MKPTIATVALLIALAVAGCDTSTVLLETVVDPSPAIVASPSAEPSVQPSPSQAPDATPSPIPAAPSVVAWPRYRIPMYTTAGGADLAVPGRSADQYLHAVVSNLEEAWPGYRDASAYVRSDDGGQTWRQRPMLGGMFPSVAAAGSHAYVAYIADACGEGIGIRRSADRGAKGSWSPVQCLTRDGDGISWSGPVIEAVGRHVFVSAYEDARHLASVWASHDRGHTWTHTQLRTRRKPLPDSATPSNVWLAARGKLVVVAWNARRSAVARVSTDHGRHWASPVRVSDGRLSSLAASGSRLAMTGVADYAPWLSTWSGDQWVSVSLPDPKTGTAVDYPDYRVALRGGLEIGLLHGPCFDTQPHSITWITSADGGATWGEPEPVKGCFNEEATVAWSDAGDVVVLSGGGDGYVVRRRP